MENLKFKFRGFVSLLTTATALISLFSGIVLYFTPQGKIAHWTNWTFCGLDKEIWGALHINSSLILFIVAIFHTYYNWGILIGYIKKKASMALNLKSELFITTVLSVFVIIASIYNIQPFGKIIRWNEDIKDYWANQAEARPPIPHAEAMTVTEFCEKLNIPLDKFQRKLNQRGWKFETQSETIKDIAKRNEISPADIYKLLQSKNSANEQIQGRKQGLGQGLGQGRGWGRKSLQDVCAELGKNTDEVIKLLTAKGFSASKETLLRDIAAQQNLRSYDVIDLINAGESH